MEDSITAGANVAMSAVIQIEENIGDATFRSLHFARLRHGEMRMKNGLLRHA